MDVAVHNSDHMRTLDLRQVEVFYYVAKFRSFSKAAEALLLTQPTISGHIKTLEESLALVLFDRLGREIMLTQAGEVLYSYESACSPSKPRPCKPCRSCRAA